MADLQVDFDILNRYRIKANLKWYELAERIGVESHTLWNWRKGNSHPRVPDLGNLIDALNYAMLQLGIVDHVDLLKVLKR
jgi:transcriptional regulator with XRE-family HTH domain